MLEQYKGRFRSLARILFAAALVCFATFSLTRIELFGLLGCLVAGVALSLHLWSVLSKNRYLADDTDLFLVFSVCLSAGISLHWDLIAGFFWFGVDLGLAPDEADHWHHLYWIGPATGLFALVLWVFVEMSLDRSE